LARASLATYTTCMGVTLKIHWDGPSEALRSHEFSVKDLGPALDELRRSIRSIVSKLSQGKDPDEADASHAAARVARGLDIRIQAVEPGCVQLDTRVVLENDEQLELIPAALASQAVAVLGRHLEEHSRGTPRKSVARYLEQISTHVKVQRYRAYDGEKQLFPDLEISEMAVVDEPVGGPVMLRFSASVLKLTLVPGKQRVVFGPVYGSRQVAASATEEQVDLAYRLHKADRLVRVWAVGRINDMRVVKLVPVDEEWPEKISAESVSDYVFSRWDETLHRLAQ